jgi:hypothetical protein
MSVLIPILLWCGLITLWLVTPRRPVWQARARSRGTAAALADRPGAVPEPDGGGTGPWRAAPFHYGTHRRREHAALGELAGRSVLSYAYCTVDNGVAHWSDVLELRLPWQAPTLEVFHELPYTSARVPLPTSLSVQPTGDPEADRAWQVRYDEAVIQDREPARAVVGRLREAPEPFSLRAGGGTLVVWRDGGFASAVNAEACAAAALAAVASFGATVQGPLAGV